MYQLPAHHFAPPQCIGSSVMLLLSGSEMAASTKIPVWRISGENSVNGSGYEKQKLTGSFLRKKMSSELSSSLYTPQTEAAKGCFFWNICSWIYARVHVLTLLENCICTEIWLKQQTHLWQSEHTCIDNRLLYSRYNFPKESKMYSCIYSRWQLGCVCSDFPSLRPQWPFWAPWYCMILCRDLTPPKKSLFGAIIMHGAPKCTFLCIMRVRPPKSMSLGSVNFCRWRDSCRSTDGKTRVLVFRLNMLEVMDEAIH